MSNKTIQDIYAEIQEVYQRFPQPWVIGYSGGKDSTTVLQLVWYALAQLPESKRQKHVYVIASDTKVETPLIVGHINSTLSLINDQARQQGMPFSATKVEPVLNDTFWVNLIGRGYPAPTTRFRWCTERLKIRPSTRFIQEKVTAFGEVILILGIRKAESSTRMQLMNSYQIGEHVLRRNGSTPGAYVYAPIADMSTDEVWSYLQQVKSPWGGDNRKLVALYRNASAGECPLMIDESAPSCGSSRFGCWVCTVAERDYAMEAMIDNGEEWLEPLLELRDFLAMTSDPDRKLEYRDIRGRDGRVVFKKDGTAAARTFKLEVSKDILRKLLTIDKSVREKGIKLIDETELAEIRRIWRIERQDWGDSVAQIYLDIFGIKPQWIDDDDEYFGENEKELLVSICKEHSVPYEIVAKLIEVERSSFGMARRANVFREIRKILHEEWRSEDQIINSITATDLAA
ncbi:3'-phosphoadenosine 5'-phosphosulfate sulfurtransferase DndC [Dehalococcoides mccartyi]|uniref:3'-phosphoadenosine 5'-phosphosulfate sulfurtransferase DndC n=1 Tax=Dehalococcoides mccartyi TaxID=61435 RepID=A0A328EQB3_9CHLR|nr:3'-phosphoadenosine 5'-phosphosulfate sulfurtransferase DndC [Dehalococcoides mccartyi]